MYRQLALALRDWKKRRSDKRTENYWKTEELQGKLNSWQEYQKEWNFIEVEYNDTSSNNRLDLMNPGFAFTTNLVKYLVDCSH